MHEEEEEKREGIDLTEIVSGEEHMEEENFTETLHDAIASNLASEATEAEQSPQSVDGNMIPQARPIRDCLLGAFFVGGLLVAMVALLLMGYFVGYYDGDAAEHEENRQTEWPDMANGTLTGL